MRIAENASQQRSIEEKGGHLRCTILLIARPLHTPVTEVPTEAPPFPPMLGAGEDMLTTDGGG